MNKYFEEFLINYKRESNLEKRVELIWDSGEIYFDSSGPELKIIFETEIKNCKEANYLDGEIVLRLLYIQSNLVGNSLDNIVAEIKFIEENIHRLKIPQILGFAYMFLGVANAYQGNYAKAFDNVLLSKKSFEGFENYRQFGWVDYNLAVIHSDLKDYENAIEKFTASYQFFKEINFDYGIARCQTGMAAVLMQQGDLEVAEKLYNEALITFKDLRIQSALSRVYNDLGIIYRKRKEFSRAIDNLNLALDIRKSINHQQGIATTLNDLGELYLDIDENTKAINVLNESVILCTRINNHFKLSKAHQLLYFANKKNNNIELALHHLEEHGKYKDIVTNSSTNNRIKELEKKAATEKAEKEAEIEKLRNVELKYAFDIIEEKNKEILDSINYARRIQYTLLASDEILYKYLPNHFVLFKPKDIVSGDFYWFSKAKSENESESEVFYLAVCDSTGHGVPGAFMSLLNITYLNEAINEKNIAEPGKILDYVRERLIQSVSQDGAKDGMDATLMKFDVQPFDQTQGKRSKLEVTYAAAHNAPYLVRNSEISELPFDKMPVGKGELSIPFTTHEINIEKGDMIYLGTDGYADQFGGEKFGVKKAGGKKFKKSNLKSLLLANEDKDLNEQKEILQSTFENWRGSLEQVDDVCIIGVRI